MTILPRLSASEAETAFAQDMADHGYIAGQVIADQEDYVRFDAPGDKPGRRNGYYKLITGRFPIGWYGDWKTGDKHEWRPDYGRELTQAERNKIKAQQRKAKAQADVVRETRQMEVAQDAQKIWGEAHSDVENHPYLAAKQITVPRSLRIHRGADGKELLAVPMYSFNHAAQPEVVNIQFIGPDGTKRFMKSGRVERSFFSIKGDTSLIIICEGVATGFKIWEATGASVVCAFNAGNLIDVAKEFARHRPLATLMIAGDDDVMAPDDWDTKGRGRPWVNAGAVKAEAAAKAVGCRWVLPVFADGPARGRTDFDDLFRLEGKERVAQIILGALRSVEAEDSAPGAAIVQLSDYGQDETWRQNLPKTPTGKFEHGNVTGVASFIKHHPLLKGRLAFNMFTQALELDGNEMADHHVAQFRNIIHKDRFNAKKGDVEDEMYADARRNSYDPLADYLNGVVWDGVPRLSRWLVDYIGAADTEYSAIVGRKFLIGAVARALSPGCKMDTMLVLEGPQGAGKSTVLRYLFSDTYFIDHLPDFHSKDSFQQLQGAWCVEVAELSALGKADVRDVKQFLSRLVDKFRPPFGKLPVQIPRRSVFAGTVNPEKGSGYLRDTTGARRFWPVECGTLALDKILRDRDQLWAEAVAAFKNKEPWFLDDEKVVALAAAQQEKRREIDPWEGALSEYLAGHRSDQTMPLQSIRLEDALTNGVRVPLEKQTPLLLRRCAAALASLGWKDRGHGPSLEYVRPGVAGSDDDWVAPEWR